MIIFPCAGFVFTCIFFYFPFMCENKLNFCTSSPFLGTRCVFFISFLRSCSCSQPSVKNAWGSCSDLTCLPVTRLLQPPHLWIYCSATIWCVFTHRLSSFCLLIRLVIYLYVPRVSFFSCLSCVSFKQLVCVCLCVIYLSIYLAVLHIYNLPIPRSLIIHLFIHTSILPSIHLSI